MPDSSRSILSCCSTKVIIFSSEIGGWRGRLSPPKSPSFGCRRPCSGPPLHKPLETRQMNAHTPTDPHSFDLSAGHVAPERRVREPTILLRLRVTNPLS